MVGPTFVSTIYHGKATYDAAQGPRPARFVCLHGGVGKDAVFVYTLHAGCSPSCPACSFAEAAAPAAST